MKPNRSYLFSEFSRLQKRCDSFCKGAQYFTLTDWINSHRTLCKCFDDHLSAFDCAEEVGVELVQVFCKEVHLGDIDVVNRWISNVTVQCINQNVFYNNNNYSKYGTNFNVLISH